MYTNCIYVDTYIVYIQLYIYIYNMYIHVHIHIIIWCVSLYIYIHIIHQYRLCPYSSHLGKAPLLRGANFAAKPCWGALTETEITGNFAGGKFFLLVLLLKLVREKQLCFRFRDQFEKTWALKSEYHVLHISSSTNIK